MSTKNKIGLWFLFLALFASNVINPFDGDLTSKMSFVFLVLMGAYLLFSK